MSSPRTITRLLAAVVIGAFVFSPSVVRAQSGADDVASSGASPGDRDPAFTVDGQLALHAFVALSDAHMQKMADVLTLLAGTDAARSADWERIRPLLTEAAGITVPAVHWFSLPDGSYWTLEEGRVAASLADRAYFPRLLAGETVLGDLVVSHSTSRNTAIVAVPVRGQDNAVVGMLGSSIHLDSLGALIRRELGDMPDGLIFYAIDAQPLGALNSDPSLIFTDPMKIGDEGMRRAFTEMLRREEGVVSYTFHGGRRIVLYRRSPLTGWWHGFGAVQPLEGLPTRIIEREVTLGGLFSLTGNWPTLGRTARAAMDLAVDDVNQYLAGNAAGVKFVAAIEDTRLDPELGLEKAQSLRDQGVQLLIGPLSSRELESLKPFVDANNMLLVSPSSTAGTLTIAGDNVFRFTPADNLEAVAVSTMMREDGIRALIPIWRDDAGGTGLERATRAAFGRLGGTVLEGVRYPPDAADYDAVLSAAQSQLEHAVGQYGEDAVGIYLVAFDEAVELLSRAAAAPALGSVRWYGSDALAHSEALLENPAAVEFAIRTGLPNPIFGMEEGAREIWSPLAERIHQRAGIEPDAFALAVYDAVWVVARGYIASGATRDIEKLKHAVTTAASTGYGATGWTILNDAGDRRHGDFDFWAVHKVDGVPKWVRIAQFESRTGRLVR